MIPQVEDYVVTAIRDTVKNKLKMECEYILANLREANYGLDNIVEINKPVFVHLTNKSNDNEVEVTGNIKRIVTVIGLMLIPVEQSTSDMSSEEANKYINQMRMLSENLIWNLNTLPITHKDTINKFKNDEEFYGQFDSNLYGVSLVFNWPISTGVTGCYK